MRNAWLHLIVAFLWCAVASSLSACGDDNGGYRTHVAPGDPFMSYESGGVSVIGADPAQAGGGSVGDADGPAGDGDGDGDGDAQTVATSPVLVGTPDGDAREAEVCIADSLCEVPETAAGDFCEREGGPVDLIYVDGELVETICYPPSDDTDRPVEVIDTTEPGDIDIVQMANRTTVVVDPATDGMPIEGDLTVDGNNVSIYGNGPDNTILDGEVTLDGNNTRLRGVTITGDLVIRKNRVAIVLCRILGNVRLETMSTNGSVFAENDIFGDFTSTSNHNLFVSNDVLGEFTHEGNENVCDGNFAFSDEDGDERVDDEERGDALACP